MDAIDTLAAIRAVVSEYHSPTDNAQWAPEHIINTISDILDEWTD